MKALLLCFVSFLTLFGQTYLVDTTQTKITFIASKFMVMDVEGTFKKYTS